MRLRHLVALLAATMAIGLLGCKSESTDDTTAYRPPRPAPRAEVTEEADAPEVLTSLPAPGETLDITLAMGPDEQETKSFTVGEIDEEALAELGISAYPGAVGCTPTEPEEGDEEMIGMLTLDDVAKVEAFYKEENPNLENFDIGELMSAMMEGFGESMEEAFGEMAEGMEEAVDEMAEGMEEAMEGIAEGAGEPTEDAEEGTEDADEAAEATEEGAGEKIDFSEAMAGAVAEGLAGVTFPTMLIDAEADLAIVIMRDEAQGVTLIGAGSGGLVMSGPEMEPEEGIEEGDADEEEGAE